EEPIRLLFVQGLAGIQRSHLDPDMRAAERRISEDRVQPGRDGGDRYDVRGTAPHQWSAGRSKAKEANQGQREDLPHRSTYRGNSGDVPEGSGSGGAEVFSASHILAYFRKV